MQTVKMVVTGLFDRPLSRAGNLAFGCNNVNLADRLNELRLASTERTGNNHLYCLHKFLSFHQMDYSERMRPINLFTNDFCSSLFWVGKVLGCCCTTMPSGRTISTKPACNKPYTMRRTSMSFILFVCAICFIEFFGLIYETTRHSSTLRFTFFRGRSVNFKAISRLGISSCNCSHSRNCREPSIIIFSRSSRTLMRSGGGIISASKRKKPSTQVKSRRTTSVKYPCRFERISSWLRYPALINNRPSSLSLIFPARSTIARY